MSDSTVRGTFAGADRGAARGGGPRPAGTDVVVLVVMGVSGTGKSTVAGNLADRLGWDLEEGDDLHPEANVAKMRAGEPLTDEDRWPWLDEVGGWIRAHVASGTPGVITCSALKRSYRDRLRGPGVVFVHLAGDRSAVQTRMSGRRHHFMPASLLDSQLATLEPLQPDEHGVVVGLGALPGEEAALVLDALGLTSLAAPADDPTPSRPALATELSDLS